jgi:hypothetical protein
LWLPVEDHASIALQKSHHTGSIVSAEAQRVNRCLRANYRILTPLFFVCATPF